MGSVDQKSIVRAVVFLLAWINTLLVSQHMKTLPVLDQTQVSLGVALVVSVWGFIQHNFLKKESVDKPSSTVVK